MAGKLYLPAAKGQRRFPFENKSSRKNRKETDINYLNMTVCINSSLVNKIPTADSLSSSPPPSPPSKLLSVRLNDKLQSGLSNGVITQPSLLRI